MAKYDPKKIEAKWQKKWLDEKAFRAKDDSIKPKYYQLETFPYPSAAGLHVGHPKGYIAEDVHARFMRMRGHEVLYTMGWDAFGLPTENYAIKVGKSPKEVASENTKNFKRQVQMFGLSYDWDREINTASPEYYKWTQWLFIRLFKRGLAYRAKAKVNWCPKDQTVLANEQVVNGRCERCGSEIEERDMEQWFLKITDYAERLLDGLPGLDWPAATVKRQEDWIGKSDGAEIDFLLSFKKNPEDNERRGPNGERAAIRIFTTRPDTLFGATYLVLAPEHAWVTLATDDGHDVLDNKAEVKAYAEATKHKTDLMREVQAKEKTGVELKGVKAINPATGEEISIWVADYVLGSYGTGAIMAVPAHDERDFEFAKKFGLPVKTVIEPETGKQLPNEEFRESIVAVVEDPETKKFLVLDWGPQYGGDLFIGGGIEKGEDPVQSALREIQEETGYHDMELVSRSEKMHHHYFAFSKHVARASEVTGLYFRLKGDGRKENKLEAHENGKFKVKWNAKDEILARMQDENHLLVFKRLVLGEMYSGYGKLAGSGKFTGMDSETAKWKITEFAGGKKKIQYKLRDWSVSRQRYWGVPIPMVHCPQCGIVPVPDDELPVTLPDLKDYRPHGMPPLASSPEFIGVKCPQCGGEAKRDPETLDTFVDSSWYYLRYADPHNANAIFDKDKAKHWLPVDLYVIGAEHTVLHLLYSRFITKFLYDEGLLAFDEPFLKLRHQGLIRGADGQKMSKSKGNVVNPDEIVGEFGADSVRLYEMFMGPFEEGQPWDPQGILGVERFLKRCWNFAAGHAGAVGEASRSSGITLQKTIKKVTEDIEGFKFNTAVSALMIFLNEAEKNGAPEKSELEIFIKLLHPFAPHLAQEAWSMLGHASFLDFEPWPAYDPKLIADTEIRLVLQVNGKVRDTIMVTADIDEPAAKEAALASEKVRHAMAGKEPRKVIYVEKRLVNVVV
ncbi:MAG: class I tRNA ligase family protein [Patescibacteria group bacterium]|nr:class I tRNA ligase family protein [Patescibacteria group bacterium]